MTYAEEVAAWEKSLEEDPNGAHEFHAKERHPRNKYRCLVCKALLVLDDGGWCEVCEKNTSREVLKEFET